MIQEEKLQKESERGDRAKELLESPLMVEARELITKNLHDKWEATKATQTQEREYIFMQLKAHNEVFRHLQSVMATGTMAKHTLKEKFEQWKRKR